MHIDTISSLDDLQAHLARADVVLDAAYLADLVAEVSLKFAEGFPVTVTDVWARALSRHFANGTTAANFFDGSLTHGAGITLSSITNVCVLIERGSVPFSRFARKKRKCARIDCVLTGGSGAQVVVRESRAAVPHHRRRHLSEPHERLRRDRAGRHCPLDKSYLRV